MSSLGLYSENEDADELGERELVFMSVAWVLGEVEGRRGIVREAGPAGRGGTGDEGRDEVEEVGGVRMDGRAGAVRRSDVSNASNAWPYPSMSRSAVGMGCMVLEMTL